MDSIACNGHGQCPTGYHCELSSGQSVGTGSVCVPGEATAAGFGASVQRVVFASIDSSLGLLGALHTSHAEFSGIQEAINEDVLGIPLLLDVGVQEGTNQPQARYRATGDSFYSALEWQYLGPEERPAVSFVADSLADRSAVDVGASAFGPNGVSNRLDAESLHCGQAKIVPLDNSPHTFAEGAGWQVESMFTSGGAASGPAMPTLPAPQGGQLTAGRVLLAPGSALRLQVPDAGADPSALDTFLLFGQAFVEGNSPDCGEVLCNNGVDDDHDGKTDCNDKDCQGEEGRYPGSLEDIICPEAVCWDGIDNDRNGLTDCDDESCEDQDCTPRPADIVAFPLSEDGSLEVAWEQLPVFANRGPTDLLMAWGRTRSRVALDGDEGIESAMLSSTQWKVLEAAVLDDSQYVVSVDAQHDKGAPGRMLHIELTPLDDLKSWSGDYLVGGVDRFGHLFAAPSSSNPESFWVTASEANSLSVQLDATSLCRGVTTIAVTNASFPESGDDVCVDCGVGSLDNRRPPLQCDVVLPPEEGETDIVTGQVACASFSEFQPGESRVHRYSFDAVAGISYLIEGLADQISTDSSLNLQFTFHYDDNGNQRLLSEGEWGLVQSEQDYCGEDPRLVWHCPESGRYQLKVEPADVDGDGGAYKLLIETL